MSYINNCPQPLQAQEFHCTFESKETRFQGRSQVAVFLVVGAVNSCHLFSLHNEAECLWQAWYTKFLGKITLAQTPGSIFLFSTSASKLSLLVSSSIIIMSKLSFSCHQNFFIPLLVSFSSHNSSKDTEAVGSHGEEWCLSSRRHILKINTCKFKSLQAQVSALARLFHFLMTLQNVFVLTSLSYK